MSGAQEQVGADAAITVTGTAKPGEC